MNFFSHQDEARQKTKLLLLLFVLSVIVLIVVANALVALTVWLMDGQLASYAAGVEQLSRDISKAEPSYFTWQNAGKISLMVCAVIGCAIMYKWLALRAGGKRVAESLGGVRVNPATQDPQLRQVLNVVEEMALASGMPVPSVYILKGEKGINAFAAGRTAADAVIGITQGSLDQFNREQLQGVIAHEFSHILNGDMRLNMQMITLLHGIVFIGAVGEFLTRSGGYHGYHHAGKRASDVRLFLLGLALWVLGWLGLFLGGLIKAAISRQREFLADAAAVQFTRNPKGIADALKIIGGYNAGSRVYSAGTREASHMFISQALGVLARFDTHPPLAQRIKRIEPSWDGCFEIRQIKLAQPASKVGSTLDNMPASNAPLQSTLLATTAASLLTDSGDSRADSLPPPGELAAINSLPAQLREQAHDPFAACALVYALLLSCEQDVQTKQLAYIKQAGIAGMAIQTLEFLPHIDRMNSRARLPLLELVVPALKTMSARQYRRFKQTLLLLIRADRRFDMFEWCLYQLVRHYLQGEFEPEKASHSVYKQPDQVRTQYQLVLSTLVHHGHNNDPQTAAAAFACAAHAVGLNDMELLPVDACMLDDFVRSVNTLANCYPLLKPRLLKGLAQCAGFDRQVTSEELEIIAAIAAVMDCPMPQLLESL